MKKKTGLKAWYALLTMLVMLVVAALSGCGKNDDPSSHEGPETGVYYYYTDNGDYTATLSGGNKFALNIGNGEKLGSYTISGNTITITFANAADGSASATLADNNVLTLTYNDSEMIFRRAVPYTVKFETGAGSKIADQTVTNGRTLARPADPTWEGHRLIGWYTDSAYTTPFAFGATPVTANLTLYARWAEVTPGQLEFEVKFDANGADGSFASMQTVGGKLYDLPVPVRAGYEFKGWWIGDSAEVLYEQVTENTVFKANTTVYALWQSTATSGKLPAPVITVTDKAISWGGIAGANGGYVWEVLDAEGTKVDGNSTPLTSVNFNFTALDPGTYTVHVTAVSTVSANSTTATVYYKHKVLDKVSKFEVTDSSILFNKVDNATAYYITVVCGNTDHDHENVPVPVGESMSYSFANCSMKEGGIEFTVTAVADGYASSVSETFYHNPTLDAVTGLHVDDETQTVSWNAVPNATGYLVSVECGNEGHSHVSVNVGNKTSFSIKECGNKAGGIKITVVPVNKAYNSPKDNASISYDKKVLATPGNVVVNGSLVNWDPVDGATGYALKVDGKTVSVSGTSYDLNNAGIEWTQNKEYKISVQATGATVSAWSDEVGVNYNTMGSLTYHNKTVSWNGVIGATAYEVRVNGTVVATLESSATSAVVELTKTGENEISVRCADANGQNSEWATTTVYAYEISFDSRMGSGADPHSLFVAAGDKVELPASQRAGYDLAGWFTAPTGNAGKYEDEFFSGSSDITLYANWTPASFNVTYDFQGGSAGDKEGAQVTYTQDYTLDVPVPDDASFAFLGWYSAAENGVQLTDEKGNSLAGWNYTENRTVYARWARAFSFTENPDGTYSVSKDYDANQFTELTIPSMYNGKLVSVVEGDAFRNCNNLEVINIPDTVQIVESTAFSSCSKLMKVLVYHVEGNNTATYWSSDDGLLVHNNEVEGEVNLVYVPYAKTGKVVVPDGVTNIMLDVFKRSLASEVVIPTSVTYIERNAFNECSNLEKVTFEEGGDKALEISERAFVSCEQLTDIYLPSRLKSFDADMFLYCYMVANVEIESGGSFTSHDNMLIQGTTLVYCPAGKTGKVTIPVGVTEIGANAFRGCSRISEVVIPNYISAIGSSAFERCSRLAKVTFEGDAVSSMSLTIGASAFQSCYRLATVEFQQGSRVTSFGNYAFGSCTALMSFTLPASLTSVGRYAFSGCTALRTLSFEPDGSEITFESNALDGCSSLTTLNFPSTVTKIPDGLLASCTNLTEVNVDNGNNAYKSVDGVLYNHDQTEILFYPKAKGDFTLPSSVTTIGENVFNGASLTTFTIGKNVTLIKPGAFANCASLKTLSFEGGGTQPLVIEDGTGTSSSDKFGAFHKCTNLGSVNLPSRLKTVSAYMFNGCSSLSEVTIPSGITAIGNHAFNECIALTEMSLPATIKTIGDYAFAATYKGNALTTINFPEGLTSIGTSAFYYCNLLSNIELPSTLTFVGYSAFNYSGLKTVTFKDLKQTEGEEPATLTFGASYGSSRLFSGCTQLTSVKLPEGLTSIPDYTFSSCSKLTSLTIPSTVTSIGASWVSGCSSLQTVTFAVIKDVTPAPFTSLPTSSYGALFGGLEALTTVNNLGKRIPEIPNYAFRGCTALTSIDLTGVTKIGSCAFQNSGLTSINIPDSVTSIADNAFAGCTNLAAVEHFSANVTELADNLFQNTGFTSFTIANTITKLGKGVFANSTKLQTLEFETGGTKSLTMTEGTSVSDGLAGNCTALTTVKNIPARLTNLAAHSFRGCSLLDSVTFEKGGTDMLDIGGNAFHGTKLASIELPLRTRSLGSGVFTNCSLLAEITVETAVQTAAEGDTTTVTMQPVFASVDGILYKVNDDGVADTLYLCPVARTKAVVVPNYVKKIENAAFYNCASVTSVTFQEGGTVDLEFGSADVSSSSASIFYGSGVTSITIPARTTKIGAYAFYANSSSSATRLTSLTFEDTSATAKLTTIGANAFGYQGFESVNVPLSVSSIGNGAFGNCASLTSVTLTGKFENFTSIFTGSSAIVNYNITAVDGALVKAVGGVLFNADETTLLVYPVGKTDTTYTIPSTVTSIEANAFKGNQNLTSIAIPATVTSIGNNAFNGCSNLATLTFTAPASGNGENLTIGNGAFNGTALTSLSLPVRVTSIGSDAFRNISALKTITFADNTQNVTLGNYAFAQTGITAVDFGTNCKIESLGSELFYNCKSLVDVTLPSHLTTTGTWTFENCSALESITLPDSLVSIGTRTFSGCTSLTNVTFGNHTALALDAYAFNGCSSLASLTLPNTLTSIGNQAFMGCTVLKSLDIPASVRSLGTEIFTSSGVETVTIPGSITAIGNKLFAGASSLKKVVLSEGVTRIEDGASSYWSGDTGAFKSLTSLKEVVLPSTLEYIGINAFNLSGIASITIPASVTEIGDNAFRDCYWLESVSFGKDSKLEKLGASAFYGCEVLSSIEFTGNRLSVIGGSSDYYGVFMNCTALETVVLPQGLTTINRYTFYNCPNLANLELPTTVTSIGEQAFYGTGFTSFTLPSTVYSVGNSMFNNCKNLAEVILPSTIESIGNSAFAGCTSLTSITLPAGLGEIGSNAFQNSGLTSIVIPNGVSTIGSEAFSGCTALGTVTLGSGVNTIKTSAFEGCTSLETIELPDGVVSIEREAFAGCTSLTSYTLSGDNVAYAVDDGVIYNTNKTVLLAFPAGKTGEVTIPATVKSVGDYAFAGSAVTKVIFQSGLTSIGQRAFDGAAIESVVLPEGLLTIGERAFNQSKLKSVVIPESVLTVGTYLFYQCTSLTSAEIKAQFNNLSTNMFSGCTSLSNVKLPEGLQNLGDPSSYGGYTFNGCIALESITLPSTLKSIGSYDFKDCTALTGITIPANVTMIGQNAFAGSGLISITVPATVISLGSNIFDGCKALTSVDLQCATISVGMFRNCTLAEIYIPANVTYVGDAAFSGWTEEQKINIAVSKEYVDANWCNESSYTAWNYKCEATVVYDYTPSTGA